jgi:putative transcriptional regulator
MPKLEPKTGRVLISDPFLRDPNFSRTVVLLTEHSEEGTVGFVLNNPIDLALNSVLKDKQLPKQTVFQGGPVELNTLHFIHSLGQIVPDSQQISRGIWWGGDFEEALKLIRSNTELIDHFHFYLGYSGWGEGQLDDELKEDAWLVSDINSDQIFKRDVTSPELWKELMNGLGGEFKYLSNSPIDPQLN